MKPSLALWLTLVATTACAADFASATRHGAAAAFPHVTFALRARGASPKTAVGPSLPLENHCTPAQLRRFGDRPCEGTGGYSMKTSRRIYIGAGSNGFLGGNPPEGVEPSHRKSSFFATVETSKDRWLSVFLQDYWTLEQSLTLDRVVALPGSIELIEHTGKVGRKAASRHVSGLSAHTLRL
jgi:hypothetical protein